MNDILTLINARDGSEREVFCGIRSIGMKEFYQASTTDFHPEVKFILADYLDYNDEELVRYEGQVYKVLRTYRTGHELELTVERAPAEESELYG